MSERLPDHLASLRVAIFLHCTLPEDKGLQEDRWLPTIYATVNETLTVNQVYQFLSNSATGRTLAAKLQFRIPENVATFYVQMSPDPNDRFPCEVYEEPEIIARTNRVIWNVQGLERSIVAAERTIIEYPLISISFDDDIVAGKLEAVKKVFCDLEPR